MFFVYRSHAIWAIQPAPPPPPRAPLWQVSKYWRSETGWSNSHLGFLQQDLEDREFLARTNQSTGMTSDPVDLVTTTAGATGMGVVQQSAHYHYYDSTATRNDALADALGIRKTPRPNVDDAGVTTATTTTTAQSRGRTEGRSGRRSLPRPKGTNTTTTLYPANNNNASLLSPSVRHNAGTTQDSTHYVENMEVDASMDTVGGRPPLLTMGPFASLDPTIAMTCLYEDHRCTTEATNIFVASNVEGSGRLNVCLVCPAPEGSQHPNVLRMFPFHDIGHTMEGEDVGTTLCDQVVIGSEVCIPCVAAVPVEATPVAPPFIPHTRYKTTMFKESALDILLLQCDQQGNQKLWLYRGNSPLVECGMQEMSAPFQEYRLGTIYDLENPVSQHVDVVTRNQNEEEQIFRVAVSMRMASGGVSEMLVGALESSVYTMKHIPPTDRAALALRIRSDCVRLERRLAVDSNDDFGADSVEAVVLALFRLELHGIDINEGIGADASEASRARNSGSAWEQLLASRFHKSYEIDSPDGIFKAAFHPSGSSSSSAATTLTKIYCHSVSALRTGGYVVAAEFFRSLHFLYEDLKLDPSSRDIGLRTVGTILARLCHETGLATGAFTSCYKADLGGEWDEKCNSSKTSASSFDVGKPFSVLAWFDSLISGNLSGDDENLDPSSICDVCIRLRSFVRIYQALYEGHADHDRVSISRDLNLVRMLIEEGIFDQGMLRDRLSPGMVLPLLEVLNRCRLDHHRYDLNAEDPVIWTLIGREDLRVNADIENGLGHQTGNGTNSQGKDLIDKDHDGLSMLEHTSAMLFPEDNRIKEVGRLLRSSRPVCLNVPRAIEVSDHDYERLKQEKLMLLSRRILALPLGRGMATIGNLQPVPAEPLPVPELCLAGRVPPTNATLALDTAECAVNMKMWPEFNNGVAAGLRLPLEDASGELVSKITRTWIVYNRPRNSPSQNQNHQNSSSTLPDLGHAHGGLLMALGLRGHLTRLEMTDIFDYLTQGSITTTVGVLLGMAAK